MQETRNDDEIFVNQLWKITKMSKIFKLMFIQGREEVYLN